MKDRIIHYIDCNSNVIFCLLSTILNLFLRIIENNFSTILIADLHFNAK